MKVKDSKITKREVLRILLLHFVDYIVVPINIKKTFECRGPHNAGIKLAGNFTGSLLRKTSCQASLERENTELNARLALRQRADLLVAVVPALHLVLYFHD